MTMIDFEPKPLDEGAEKAAREKWDRVAKPLYSLGRFEEMITRAAAIQGTAEVSLFPRAALVFCGDHGVVAQGVSQSGSEVTTAVAESIAEGQSSINLMCACARTDVFCLDMGMKTPARSANILDLRVGPGTRDFTREPAMTKNQALTALQNGMDAVGSLSRKGYKLLAVGEMGIGNTTAAAALGCAYLGESPSLFVGRGSGLSDEGLLRKRQAVEKALLLHAKAFSDPVMTLACLGGFEIAGMTGAFLGGAKYGVTMVIDGVISAVAALAAWRILPAAKNYMLPSHASREPAAQRVLGALGLEPVLHADMALGEATGAVMLFPLLDMALSLYHGSHSFESLGMEAYTPFENDTGL